MKNTPEMALKLHEKLT